MTSGENWKMRAIAAGFAALGVSAASAVPVGCGADEETVFACSVGPKRVAVCGSSGWSAGEGRLQYRFGKPASAELVLPRTAASVPSASARPGELMLSGGGGATLRFSAGDVDYVVYSAVGATLGETDGVAVERAGKTVRAFKCRGPVESKLGSPKLRGPGFKADDQPFDLPE